MEDDRVTAILIASLFIGFVIGLMVGSVGDVKTSTTYNNLDIVREQLQVTQNCLNGWDSTLELLRSCNEINK